MSAALTWLNAYVAEAVRAIATHRASIMVSRRRHGGSDAAICT
ncbi:hypothetical protein [Occultella kanbiaonis]|nr:hypothetical protein [Occultella kanbiaonis]